MCDPCPAEAFCGGGTSLPLVYQGHYGKHVGDVSSAALEEQNAAKANGSFEKSAGFFQTTHVYKCENVKICPGETMEVSSHGFSAEATLTKQGLRVGFPLEGACLDNREGIACGKCEEDMFGLEECKECGGAPLNFVVVFVAPVTNVAGMRAAAGCSGHRLGSAGAARVLTCDWKAVSFGAEANAWY